MRRRKFRSVPLHAFWLSLLGHLLLFSSFAVVLTLAARDPLPSSSPPPSVPSYLSESPPATPAPPASPVAEQTTAQKEPEQKIEKTGIKPKTEKLVGLSKPKPKKSTKAAKAKPNKNRPIKFSPNAVPVDMTHPRDREPLRLVGESKIIKPLIKILARALSRHLRYPRVAADFNLSGVVLVGFVLDPDGYVTETKIVQSSGAGVLDDAARDAVASMSPVGDVHAYVEKPEFLVVGIIFG